MIHQIKAQYFPTCEYFEDCIKKLKLQSDDIEIYLIYWTIERAVRIIENQFEKSLRDNLKESII